MKCVYGSLNPPVSSMAASPAGMDSHHMRAAVAYAVEGRGGVAGGRVPPSMGPDLARWKVGQSEPGGHVNPSCVCVCARVMGGGGSSIRWPSKHSLSSSGTHIRPPAAPQSVDIHSASERGGGGHTHNKGLGQSVKAGEQTVNWPFKYTLYGLHPKCPPPPPIFSKVRACKYSFTRHLQCHLFPAFLEEKHLNPVKRSGRTRHDFSVRVNTSAEQRRRRRSACLTVFRLHGERA